jgi:hypothetical protein
LVSADIDGIPPPYALLLTPPHPRLSQLQAEMGAALVVRAPHLTADHRIPPTGSVVVWSAPSTLPLALHKLRWLRPSAAVAPLLLKIRNEAIDFAAVVAAAFRPGTPAGRPEVRSWTAATAAALQRNIGGASCGLARPAPRRACAALCH